MSVRTFPIPESMRKGVDGVCKWGCGRPVKKPARFWHPECGYQFELHTNLRTQYAYLVERDGEKCGVCGEFPRQWIRSDPINVLDWSKGSLPHDWLRELWYFRTDLPVAAEERFLLGAQCRTEWAMVLEVDHIVPLWSVAHLPDDDRRAYFGPDNLWLLCQPCHKRKTAYEAADRAAERKQP